MLYVNARGLAMAAVVILLAIVVGCVVDSGTGPTATLTHFRLQPDFNLHAAPAGRMYELWLLEIDLTQIDDDSNIVFPDPISMGKFQWDPYLYVASDPQGNFLPLTTGSGMPIGMPLKNDPDISYAFFVSIEPDPDPDPQFPTGPTIAANQMPQGGNVATMLSPFVLFPFIGNQVPAANFSLLSQSNKKGIPGAAWRDSSTEGFGIWFANPNIDNLTIVDSAGGYETYIKTFVQGDFGYLYTVWINEAYPESSFSNFGLVYFNQEPDLVFDGAFPLHLPPKRGPQTPLGEDPVFINNQLVGYRYLSSNRLDTCILRIDDPSLTRCTRDTFSVLDFETQGFTPRTFRVTDGDTTVNGTIGGIPDLSNPLEITDIGFLFVGWDYEAWLVFTEESGIKPLSLGRFRSTLQPDSENPYTNPWPLFDSNFTLPGEDFLQNLSQHDPSLVGPLNVMTDPRAEKVWITVEPQIVPGQPLLSDWAPDEPYKQQIIFSQFIPRSLGEGSALRPMTVFNLDPSPAGLTNGNSFSTVQVKFYPPPEE